MSDKEDKDRVQILQIPVIKTNPEDEAIIDNMMARMNRRLKSKKILPRGFPIKEVEALLYVAGQACGHSLVMEHPQRGHGRWIPSEQENALQQAHNNLQDALEKYRKR